jgi:Gluconate 2-dehydrogenase subunit 3
VSKPEEIVSLTIDGRRPAQVSRRQAMQWVLGAVAASALPAPGLAQEVGRTVTPQENAARQKERAGGGYGTDPDLLKIYRPGDFWPLTFDAAQKKTAAALADTIIPKDALGPAASEVGVMEMVDEWISAPYPDQQAHRRIVLEGLGWMEGESKKRFKKSYGELNEGQQREICDDIHHAPSAKDEFKKAAGFFNLFRSLCAGAYYATPAGWKAIGYVGNVALPSFDGPPGEVLEKLGVTQTVK